MGLLVAPGVFSHKNIPLMDHRIVLLSILLKIENYFPERNIQIAWPTSLQWTNRNKVAMYFDVIEG